MLCVTLLIRATLADETDDYFSDTFSQTFNKTQVGLAD